MKHFHTTPNMPPSAAQAHPTTHRSLNKRGLIFLISLFLLVIIGCAASTTSSPPPGLQLRIADTSNIENSITLTAGDELTEPVIITIKPCGFFEMEDVTLLFGGAPTSAYTATFNPTTPPSYYSASTTSYSVTVTDTEGMTSAFAFMVVIQDCNAALATDLKAGIGAGAGTTASPWIIDTDLRLNLVATLVNADNADNAAYAAYTNGHYRMTENIDLGIATAPWSQTASELETPPGKGFTPIGTSINVTDGSGGGTHTIHFKGTFDCANKVVSNLYINNAKVFGANNGAYEGLFGIVGSGGVVMNCGLVGVNISGQSPVGALAGQNNGTIGNSYVMDADMDMDISGSLSVGGLVGRNEGTIEDSYVGALSVTVVGITVGGLVGVNVGVIGSSYAAASVTGDGGGTGGLVGNNTSMISDSYATGTVTGSGDTSTGGLVGSTSGGIANSYALGLVMGASTVKGGLIGEVTGGTVTSSYWASDVMGQVGRGVGTGSATGVTGRSMTQLKVATPVAITRDASTMAITNPDDHIYSGWDTAIWEFTGPMTVGGTDGEYPKLKSVVCANQQYTTETACQGLQ